MQNRPYCGDNFGGRKKRADDGVDGKRTEKALVSFKGGNNVDVKMIRDLHSAMERESPHRHLHHRRPARQMEKEAAAGGRFEDGFGRTYSRLQIITLPELFEGEKPDIFSSSLPA